MYKLNLKIILILMLGISCFPFIYFSNINKKSATQLKETVYQEKLSVNGVIESDENIPICLSFPVYIKESYVYENSYVNKGQLMFVLDVDKMKNAVKNNSFTTLNTYNTQLTNEEIPEISPEIYACDSGIVRNISDQSIILPDEPLCIIEKSDKLNLKITLNQQDYSKISVGDTVVFSPAIAPSRKYNGIISDKTAVIRNETSLAGNKTVVDVFASIDEIDEYINNGLQCTGTVTSPNQRIIFTLPYEYINQDENGEYVNIYNSGTISKEYIETGIETENYVEIKTSLPLDTIFIKDNFKGKLLIEQFE